MGIEKIIEKIKIDAENKIKEIEESYRKKYEENKRKYEEIIAEKRKSIERMCKEKEQEILKNTEINAKIKAKLDILNVKHKIIQQLIANVINQFIASERYREIIIEIAKKYGNEGEIISGQREKEFLKSAGINAFQNDEIKGIIIKKGKSSYNFTIDSALSTLEEDLKYEIGKILFD